MKTADVIDYYHGSVADVADALSISVQAVYAWKEYPPSIRQFEIEIITKGKLRAERRAPRRKVA